MQILTFLLIINIFNLKSYTAKSSSKTSDVIDLKTSNFERKLMNYDWALVKFCASWCTDCKNLAPEYERAASILKSLDESMVLTQIDCDNEPKICQTYKIKGYPTLKLFKNANLKSDYNGNYSTDDILNYMMNYSANLNKTSKIFNVSTSEGLKNSLNKVKKFNLFSL